MQHHTADTRREPRHVHWRIGEQKADLRAARERVGPVVEGRHEHKVRLLLVRQLHICADRAGDAEHIVVLAVEEAHRHEVDRRGERRREQEGGRDVHSVEVVARVEPLVPVVVAAVDDDLRRIGGRDDRRAGNAERGDKDRNRVVDVGQDKAVGKSLQELRDAAGPNVANEQMGVVEREDAHNAICVEAGAEAELEAGQQNEVNGERLILLPAALALAVVADVGGPAEDMGEHFDAREDLAEVVQRRVLWGVEQIEEL